MHFLIFLPPYLYYVMGKESLRVYFYTFFFPLNLLRNSCFLNISGFLKFQEGVTFLFSDIIVVRLLTQFRKYKKKQTRRKITITQKPFGMKHRSYLELVLKVFFLTSYYGKIQTYTTLKCSVVHPNVPYPSLSFNKYQFMAKHVLSIALPLLSYPPKKH